MLSKADRVGQDKKGKNKLNQRIKENVESFIKGVLELQEKFNVELNPLDTEVLEKNGPLIGYLEYNYDTIDVTFEDETIVSIKK